MDAFHRELAPLPTCIIGERVTMRPWRRGDGAALFEAIDEDRERLRAWLPWVDHHRTPEDSEAYVRRAFGNWVTREDLPVALVDPRGRIAGGSGLTRIDWEARSFEIGYWIRGSSSGGGLVTEAVSLLAALGFDRLAATRVWLHCHVDNERSAAVARRLDFALEARLANAHRSHLGHVHDVFVFALTPESFAGKEWSTPARAIVARADWEG